MKAIDRLGENTPPVRKREPNKLRKRRPDAPPPKDPATSDISKPKRRLTVKEFLHNPKSIFSSRKEDDVAPTLISSFKVNSVVKTSSPLPDLPEALEREPALPVLENEASDNTGLVQVGGPPSSLQASALPELKDTTPDTVPATAWLPPLPLPPKIHSPTGSRRDLKVRNPGTPQKSPLSSPPLTSTSPTIPALNSSSSFITRLKDLTGSKSTSQQPATAVKRSSLEKLRDHVRVQRELERAFSTTRYRVADIGTAQQSRLGAALTHQGFFGGQKEDGAPPPLATRSRSADPVREQIEEISRRAKSEDAMTLLQVGLEHNDDLAGMSTSQLGQDARPSTDVTAQHEEPTAQAGSLFLPDPEPEDEPLVTESFVDQTRSLQVPPSAIEFGVEHVSPVNTKPAVAREAAPASVQSQAFAGAVGDNGVDHTRALLGLPGTICPTGEGLSREPPEPATAPEAAPVSIETRASAGAADEHGEATTVPSSPTSSITIGNALAQEWEKYDAYTDAENGNGETASEVVGQAAPDMQSKSKKPMTSELLPAVPEEDTSELNVETSLAPDVVPARTNAHTADPWCWIRDARDTESAERNELARSGPPSPASADEVAKPNGQLNASGESGDPPYTSDAPEGQAHESRESSTAAGRDGGVTGGEPSLISRIHGEEPELEDTSLAARRPSLAKKRSGMMLTDELAQYAQQNWARISGSPSIWDTI